MYQVINVNDQCWSFTTFKNHPLLSTLNVILQKRRQESQLLKSQTSRKSLGKITSEEKKKPTQRYTSCKCRKVTEERIFYVGSYTWRIDEVANKEHVLCGLAARSEIVMASSCDSMLG